MRIIASLAVMAAALSAGAVQAASITNGSFEAPIAPGGSFATYAAGSSSLTGWTISNASIDHIGAGFWQASDGTQSLDLNGSSGAATVSQMVTGLVVGQAYRILFDMAGNPQGLPDLKTMDVEIGMAGPQSYSFNKSGKTTAAMGWTTFAYDFVAGGTSGELRFISTTSGNAFGPALDNVRFAPAPIPLPASAVLLLAGLGGLGLMRRKG